MNTAPPVSHATEHASAKMRLQAETSLRKRVEARAAFLEDFNRLLIESTGDCILVIDPAGKVLTINQTGCRMLGTASAEALDRHWAQLFPELEVRPAADLHLLPKLREPIDASSKTAAGETRFWRLSFTSFAAAAPEAEQILLVASDVTEQVRAERAVRQSEEAFRKIFEENPLGILLADLDYRILKVNNALSAMLGFSCDELLRRSLPELTRSSDTLKIEEFQRLLHGEIRSFQSEAVFETKRRQPVWGHVTTSILRDGEDCPVAIFQMVENIQDRKSTEEQVLSYQEQLQTLASELSLSEERERRRIATNLHDQVGQSLAFARLKLAAMCETGGKSEEVEPDTLRKLRELIDQAIADTRSLTFELSPPVLYELGLVAALEWLVRKIRQEHQIQTRFHDDGQPKPLDDNLRVVLFQAVRELLVNIVKHAKATHAQVTVRRDADAMRIVIEDDGVGFELSKVKGTRESARSFGLFNIRERVEYLGGKVKIRSELGRGTRVTLIAPLRIEENGRIAT